MNFVGTAGWSLPKASRGHFPEIGSHLERYAQVLNCVEINSSFYRAHSFKTYRNWAASTPATFRFSVKVPRAVTHDARLRRARAPLVQFLAEVKGLGRKLGPLLLQLPPSMEFETRLASRFFAMLGDLYRGPIVCEPRHESWFEPRADRTLSHHGVSRAAADPAKTQLGVAPGGALQRLRYFRLHGSPRMYWSNYSEERLGEWARQAAAPRSGTATWFVFDNTASGCATSNALQLMRILPNPSKR